jgi:hypothetical protein
LRSNELGTYASEGILERFSIAFKSKMDGMEKPGGETDEFKMQHWGKDVFSDPDFWGYCR